MGAIQGCMTFWYMVIIDDYSKKVWTYNKSDTFERFKEWKMLVENQIDWKAKRLRTDNGLEYLSNEFNQLCKVKCIARHRTVRETP